MSRVAVRKLHFKETGKRMNRLLSQRLYFMLVVFAAANIVTDQSARASQRDTILRAANAYRAAVTHFTTEVRRSRHVDRHTVRLVSRLEDKSSDLRSAARRPTIIHRLLSEYTQVESLQYEVEVAVFGHGDPNVAFNLGGCWEEVVCCQQLFAVQLQRLQQGNARIPTRRASYSLLPSTSHPSVPQHAHPYKVYPGQPSPYIVRYRGQNWESSPRGTSFGTTNSQVGVGGAIKGPRVMPPVMSRIK